MIDLKIGKMLPSGKYSLNVPFSCHKGGIMPRKHFIIGTPNTISANISVQSINDFRTASLNLEIYENGDCYWTFNNGDLIEKGEGRFQEIRDNKITLSEELILVFESHEMARRALKRFKLRI